MQPTYEQAGQPQPMQPMANPYPNPNPNPTAPPMQQNVMYQQAMQVPMPMPMPQPYPQPPYYPQAPYPFPSGAGGGPLNPNPAPVAFPAAAAPASPSYGNTAASPSASASVPATSGSSISSEYPSSASEAPIEFGQVQLDGQTDSGPIVVKRESASSTSWSNHVRILVVTVLFLGFMIAFLAKFDDGSKYSGRSFTQKLHGATLILFIIMIVLAAAYLASSFNSLTWLRLSSGRLDESLQHYLARLRSTQPRLSLRCRCSHQERRTRRDSDGNTETYYVTVVTYEGREEFSMGNDMMWMDCSDILPSMLRAMTQVECSLHLLWGDDVAKSRFEAAKFRFIGENRHRDIDFEYWDAFELDGLLLHALATPYRESGRSGVVETDPRAAPPGQPQQNVESMSSDEKKSVWRWWVSPFVYVISTLLLLAWPYAMVFDWSCDRINMRFRKKVCFIPYLQAQNPQPMQVPMQAPMVMPGAPVYGSVPMAAGPAPMYAPAPMQPMPVQA